MFPDALRAADGDPPSAPLDDRCGRRDAARNPVRSEPHGRSGARDPERGQGRDDRCGRRALPQPRRHRLEGHRARIRRESRSRSRRARREHDHRTACEADVRTERTADARRETSRSTSGRVAREPLLEGRDPVDVLEPRVLRSRCLRDPSGGRDVLRRSAARDRFVTRSTSGRTSARPGGARSFPRPIGRTRATQRGPRAYARCRNDQRRGGRARFISAAFVAHAPVADERARSLLRRVRRRPSAVRSRFRRDRARTTGCVVPRRAHHPNDTRSPSAERSRSSRFRRARTRRRSGCRVDRDRSAHGCRAGDDRRKGLRARAVQPRGAGEAPTGERLQAVRACGSDRRRHLARQDVPVVGNDLAFRCVLELARSQLRRRQRGHDVSSHRDGTLGQCRVRALGHGHRPGRSRRYGAARRHHVTARDVPIDRARRAPDGCIAARDGLGIRDVRERRRAHAAARDRAREGRVGQRLVRRGRAARDAGDGCGHRLRGHERPPGRGEVRNRRQRPDRTADGRQDGNDRPTPRRMARRIHARPRDGGVGRLPHPAADGERPRDQRRRRVVPVDDLATLHVARGGGQEGARLRRSGRAHARARRG